MMTRNFCLVVEFCVIYTMSISIYWNLIKAHLVHLYLIVHVKQDNSLPWSFPLMSTYIWWHFIMPLRGSSFFFICSFDNLSTVGILSYTMCWKLLGIIDTAFLYTWHGIIDTVLSANIDTVLKTWNYWSLFIKIDPVLVT